LLVAAFVGNAFTVTMDTPNTADGVVTVTEGQGASRKTAVTLDLANKMKTVKDEGLVLPDDPPSGTPGDGKTDDENTQPGKEDKNEEKDDKKNGGDATPGDNKDDENTQPGKEDKNEEKDDKKNGGDTASGDDKDDDKTDTDTDANKKDGKKDDDKDTDAKKTGGGGGGVWVWILIVVGVLAVAALVKIFVFPADGPVDARNEVELQAGAV